MILKPGIHDRNIDPVAHTRQILFLPVCPDLSKAPAPVSACPVGFLVVTA